MKKVAEPVEYKTFHNDRGGVDLYKDDKLAVSFFDDETFGVYMVGLDHMNQTSPENYNYKIWSTYLNMYIVRGH